VKLYLRHLEGLGRGEDGREGRGKNRPWIIPALCLSFFSFIHSFLVRSPSSSMICLGPVGSVGRA